MHSENHHRIDHNDVPITGLDRAMSFHRTIVGWKFRGLPTRGSKLASLIQSTSSASIPIETPTLLERFITLVNLPYPLAAIFWSAVLGSPGYYTLQYLTGPTRTFTIADLPNEILFFLAPLYLFLAVHYVRMRIVAGEAPIAARLAGGEEDYHRAFGRMNLALPPVALAFLFAVPILSLLSGSY